MFKLVLLVSVLLLFLSYEKIVIVKAVIIATIHIRILSECPKTSDPNSNATPFKELQCFDALSKGRAQVDIKRKLGQSAHIVYLSH